MVRRAAAKWGLGAFLLVGGLMVLRRIRPIDRFALGVGYILSAAVGLAFDHDPLRWWVVALAIVVGVLGVKECLMGIRSRGLEGSFLGAAPTDQRPLGGSARSQPKEP
jgi:hypothetical protein